MDVEYAAFRRRTIGVDDLRVEQFDLFLSSLNKSLRVQTLGEAIFATRRLWIVHEEYSYEDDELEGLDYVRASKSVAPAMSWAGILEGLGDLDGARVAIDITGMMRPHIAMLPFALARAGAKEATIFYSDPDSYRRGDRTSFTKGPVQRVGLIPGMEGSHTNVPSPRDVLILGAGYDHDLISAVANDKPNAEQVILLGLPSLQPHMYHESVLKLAAAGEALHAQYPDSARIFAPASDPFATAQVVSAKVAELSQLESLDHLYLTAVGPKPQVLGFAWYYWCEAAGANASFLFPFADGYEQQTTNGIAAIHEYVLELDAVRRPDLA